MIIVTGTVPPDEEPGGDVTVHNVLVRQETFSAGVEPNVTVVVPGTVENPVPIMVTSAPPATGPDAGEREVIMGALPWAIITTCDGLYPAASQSLADASTQDTAPRIFSAEGTVWLDQMEPS